MTLSGSIPVRPATRSFTPRDVKIASWICFFAWTVAVYDFVLFGNLLPAMGTDLGLSDSGATGLNTWITAGTALVAFGIGPVVDRSAAARALSWRWWAPPWGGSWGCWAAWAWWHWCSSVRWQASDTPSRPSTRSTSTRCTRSPVRAARRCADEAWCTRSSSRVGRWARRSPSPGC